MSERDVRAERDEDGGGAGVRPGRPSSVPVPSWLVVPPTPSDVPPPVTTRHQLLPLDQIPWENFERLCLRLLRIDAKRITVSAETAGASAGLYGLRGQAQHGIDVYARDPLVPGESPRTRRYVTLQSRRTKGVTKAQLKDSVAEFLDGRWAAISRKFIYATSASVHSTDLVDAIDKLASTLANDEITFEIWDQDTISKHLKAHPNIVDDFFGRAWVEGFCGAAAAEELGTRLDAKRMAEFRRELSRMYTSAFNVADSGLIALRATETKPVRLLDRFVTPDVVSTTLQAAHSHTLDDPESRDSEDRDVGAPLLEAIARNTITSGDYVWDDRRTTREVRTVEGPRFEQRRSAEQWIGERPLQVVIGEPGAGKSTLLRYLVLDLLSEEPKWRSIAERWGQRLPVWLPFHFYTQRVAGQTGAEASIGAAIRAWLQQHDYDHVWPLVQGALDDSRLLLIVDGLDEWISEEAGRSAFAALKTFADARSIPLLVSTRPYGLTRLPADASWSYARIAPLTDGQQRQLSSHFFRALLDEEDADTISKATERALDGFMAQVREAPEVRAISRTPLFLILLLGLHLSSVAKLPTGRFEVYERAVELLVAEHPAHRRTAAAVTAPRQRLSDRQLRKLLAKVAFSSQYRNDLSVIPESVLRQDFVGALRDPDDLAMDAGQATMAADELLTVAEGELGLLVRKGPGELGFLHRMLQEQLAAEYISSRLSPAETAELFRERVGDPRWREVILATMWRIQRPDELRALIGVIYERIEETPAGLLAREVFTELVFGPYDLPSVDIQRIAPYIVEVIETHPYGSHRARLLDSVLQGLREAATAETVLEYLRRWTVLVTEPTPELVLAVAQVVPGPRISELACKLLTRALQYPDTRVAFAGAVAIAGRVSRDGPGSDGERDLLFAALTRTVSEMPSGLAAAAALTALALEWRDNPEVVRILREARTHADGSVRMVAIADALGTLRTPFSAATTGIPRETQPLSDPEREWVVDHLRERRYADMHWGLLVATVCAAVRGQPSMPADLVEDLRSAPGARGRFHNFDLLWPVTLGAYADDERVVELVCEQLRSEAHSSLMLRLRMGNYQLLAQAYPPKSAHNARVAAAIEERLSRRDDRASSLLLFGLAGVDRGPVMKQVLLEDLEGGEWPHWAAEALAEHFGEDRDARVALSSVLMGDTVRASMVANAATRVLGPDEAISRLLAILRDLVEPGGPRSGRHDVVASALIEALGERRIGAGPEVEAIAAEALACMPRGDARYDLAAALYPSTASREVLAELPEQEDLPLAPYLRAFRTDHDHVERLLDNASGMLCSLPAYLRARVCRVLTAQGEPQVVMRLTHRWADEVAAPNRTIASLAYHRALLRERDEGRVDQKQWEQALSHLGEQAVRSGMDREASVRGAWVGMCVCRDWSMAKRSPQSNVSLADTLHGPDMVLLLQLAAHWEDLRSEFEEALLERLSEYWVGSTKDVWDALALVAERNSTLEQELEDAVAEDPGLLSLDGVLAWFVTRDGREGSAVGEALVSHLHSSDNRESLAVKLLADPEGIGIDRGLLREGLEAAVSGRPDMGDPALEALALLYPGHPVVIDAWRELSDLIAQRPSRADDPIDARTYFALAYAAVEADAILGQIERDLDRLVKIDRTFVDHAFARHVTHRLRRDAVAAKVIRNAVTNPETSDSRSAELLSILAGAIGIDESLFREAERRIVAQTGVILAPVIWDYGFGAYLSVRSVLSRIADAPRDIDPV